MRAPSREFFLSSAYLREFLRVTSTFLRKVGKMRSTCYNVRAAQSVSCRLDPTDGMRQAYVILLRFDRAG